MARAYITLGLFREASTARIQHVQTSYELDDKAGNIVFSHPQHIDVFMKWKAILVGPSLSSPRGTSNAIFRPTMFQDQPSDRATEKLDRYLQSIAKLPSPGESTLKNTLNFINNLDEDLKVCSIRGYLRRSH